MKDSKKRLDSAEAELAARKKEESRLQARADDLSGELQATEGQIESLGAARQSALRKAALDTGKVEIDRSALSAAQFRRDEILEMRDAVQAAIDALQKDIPRLVSNVGTARRAFMAAACSEKINRIFGQMKREEIIDLYVLNMGATATGRGVTLGEIVPTIRQPQMGEIPAAVARVKAELGFEPC
jgi:chromosome segregation ATPase